MLGLTMRADLVAVLSDTTLREHADECCILISRVFPEEKRAEWSDALTKEASLADESSDDSTAKAKAREVVAKLTQSIPGLIECTDRELEGLYNLVMALLIKYYETEEESFCNLVMHLVNVVSDTQSSAAMERSIIKYRILSNIFNLLPTASPLRLRVFKALLTLVSMNGDMDFLDVALQSVPIWLAQWNISSEEKHECLCHVADALQLPDCGPAYMDRAYEFELIHLRFISGEQSLSNEMRFSAAENAIANILRLPKLFEMEEVLRVADTLNLGTSPMLSLLKLIVSGTRADFEQWAQSSDGKGALERLSLDASELTHKMRLLDLASLCARSVSSEVSYQDMAQTLGVSVDEVEAWVIDVIRAGLVSGKLSQVKRSFRVYRSTYRTFEKSQWESLEQRLSQWQHNIQTLLKTMQNARTQAPQALMSEHQATSVATSSAESNNAPATA